MPLFKKQSKTQSNNNTFLPVSLFDEIEVLQKRVEQLEGDEFEIYKWLREFYSERWIKETLLLNRCTVKAKLKTVYAKLGVTNKKTLIKVYMRLQRPHTGMVNTTEIDRYTDARTEKEVQNKLKNKRDGIAVFSAEGGKKQDK
jgi:DNA-binding CsgD family transcriptional regulator